MAKGKIPRKLGAMFFDLEIKYMASGVKTRTFGRHVENRLKVDKHGSGFLFSLAMLKRKAPLELGAM